jgi:hypothetical protein
MKIVRSSLSYVEFSAILFSSCNESFELAAITYLKRTLELNLNQCPKNDSHPDLLRKIRFENIFRKRVFLCLSRV